MTRLAVKVRRVLPWLEPADGPAVRVWCEFEYLCSQVYSALRAYGVTNPNGEARRLLDDYRRLRSTQAIYTRELGMTPASRQAIKASGTNAALDLAAMCAATEDESTDLVAVTEPREGVSDAV